MKTLKISSKIAVLCAGLIAAGIALGSYLLLQLGQTNTTYQALRNERYVPREAVLKLDIEFRGQVQEWKNILLRGHDAKDLASYKEKFLAAEKQVRERAAAVAAASTDPAVDTMLAEFVTLYDQLSKDYAAALQTYEQTDELAALTADKMVRGKDRPAAAKLAEAVERIEKNAAVEEARVTATVAHTRRNGLILMLGLFSGLAVAGWWLARSIVGPLRQLTHAVARISDADAKDIKFRTGDDEVGQLGTAYQQLLAYIGEVGVATERLAAGDFTAHVKPRSERDLLATRFAAVTQTLQRALGEVSTLVQAAREGRLDQRADAQSFGGTYKDVMVAVNGLMEAVREPIDEAVQVMERMAERDLRVQMKGEFAGDFGRLKSAINTALADVSSSIGRVSTAAEQLALGSSEIQRGSASLAQNTTEMASAVHAISERSGRLSTAAADASSRARDSEKAASGVAELATAGVQRMDQLSSAMKKIKESASATGRIMQAINEIAFQTNLLALNAAVEAARAGDAGKGFAVVAEEVRSLALRSAESASNTGKLIEESIRAADEGVQVNGEATASLQQLAKEIHRVAGEISGVAAIVDDQKLGLNEIKQSVGEISVATQNTAALAEESASTADVLNTHGQKLQQLVEAFEVDREGVRGETRPRGEASHGAGKRPMISTGHALGTGQAANSNGSSNGHNGSNGHSRNVADLLAAF